MVKRIVFISFILFLFNFVFAIALKLPFQNGEQFYITQGYDGGTHIKNDVYALDFTKNGCEAYGEDVTAVSGGIIVKINFGDPGYGNSVKIDHGDGLMSLYGHLADVSVRENDIVDIGQVIGHIGNTGLKHGTACQEHPGTHLHFRMTQRLPDGSLVAYKPEPMSGYTNFAAGNWHKSDNQFLAKENNSPQTQPPEKGFFASIVDWVKSFFEDEQNLALNSPAGVGFALEENSLTSDGPNTPASVLQSAKSDAPPAQTSPNSLTNQNFLVEDFPESSFLENNNFSDQNSPTNNPLLISENQTPTIPPFKIIEPKFALNSLPPGFGGGAPPPATQNQAENPNDSPSETPNNEPTSTSTSPDLPPDDQNNPNNPNETALNNLEIVIPACENSLVPTECVLIRNKFKVIWQVKNSIDNQPIENETLAYLVQVNHETYLTQTKELEIVAPSDGLEQIFAISVAAYQEETKNTATTSALIKNLKSPVVINEIAWMGTRVSNSHEWLELYNRSNYEISLNNFRLESADNSPNLNLSGSIKPKGYYLIERRVMSVSEGEGVEPPLPISDWPPDLFVPFGSGLHNTRGEHLTLVQVLSDGEKEIIDEVLECANWCGFGSAERYLTMERYSADLPGRDLQNWGTYTGGFVSGHDADDEPISGTPGARNSVSFLLNNGRPILEKLILSAENNLHTISGAINVSSGALEAPPGTIFAFLFDPNTSAEPQIIFEGEAKLIGTDSRPIVFTALGDREKINLLEVTAPLAESFEEALGSVVFENGQIDLANLVISFSGGLTLENVVGQIENLKINDSVGGVNLQDSQVDISKYEATTIENTALAVGGESAVSVTESLIDKENRFITEEDRPSGGFGVFVFPEPPAISVSGEAKLEVSSTTVKQVIGDAFVVSELGELALTSSTVSNVLDSAVLVKDSASAKIERAVLAENGVGVTALNNAQVEIKESVIEDNLYAGIENRSTNGISATGNYWGEVPPSTNGALGGEVVIGQVLFSPILPAPPAPVGDL